MTALLVAVSLLFAPVPHAAGDDVPPIISPLDTTGLKHAVRLSPPPVSPPPPLLWSSTSSGGRCVGFQPLLTALSPGWDPVRMSGIMFRESRCDPSASNSCCSGLLQMHRMHVPEPVCDVWSRADLYDPVKNICSAAELWKSSSYGAWSTS